MSQTNHTLTAATKPRVRPLASRFFAGQRWTSIGVKKWVSADGLYMMEWMRHHSEWILKVFAPTPHAPEGKWHDAMAESTRLGGSLVRTAECGMPAATRLREQLLLEMADFERRHPN